MGMRFLFSFTKYLLCYRDPLFWLLLVLYFCQFLTGIQSIVSMSPITFSRLPLVPDGPYCCHVLCGLVQVSTAAVPHLEDSTL